MKFMQYLFCLLCLSAACTSTFASEPQKCSVCGMRVDPSASFSAQIVHGRQVLHFCDIGDLLLYLEEKRDSGGDAWVRDYRSGEWVQASKAFYVHAPLRFSTPMGWSIAGFKERDTAKAYGIPEDLASIRKRVVK